MEQADKVYLGVLATILLVVVVLLSSSLWFQYGQYSKAVDSVVSGTAIDHVALLTFARAWDFAIVKTSSLFLSFVLIFTGAIFVLRKADGSLNANGEVSNIKFGIAVTTPGLVLAALGVALAAFTLYDKTEISLGSPLTAVSETIETDLQ